jgi:sirohydrochlorin ferrochelatase
MAMILPALGRSYNVPEFQRGERPMRDGLLLIAHGSREDEANADLRHVASELRRRGVYAVVEASFLELAEPGIEDGGARCVSQGAERVVLLPYFLSAGVHVRRDLTKARDRLAEHFPAVDFRLAEPLGRHPHLIDVVVERAHAALKDD